MDRKPHWVFLWRTDGGSRGDFDDGGGQVG